MQNLQELVTAVGAPALAGGVKVSDRGRGGRSTLK